MLIIAKNLFILFDLPFFIVFYMV